MCLAAELRHIRRRLRQDRPLDLPRLPEMPTFGAQIHHTGRNQARIGRVRGLNSEEAKKIIDN